VADRIPRLECTKFPAIAATAVQIRVYAASQGFATGYFRSHDRHPGQSLHHQAVTPDGDLIRRAVETKSEDGLHFYDRMIVAAAERAGCERIWSEDLNAETYFGVTVANPFL
jgi:predicted nucleic acid-binding protein